MCGPIKPIFSSCCLTLEPITGAKLSIFSLVLRSSATTAVMNIGMSVCVLLAALFSSSLSLPSHPTSQKTEVAAPVSDVLTPPSADSHTRQARSVASAGQLTQDDIDARNSLNQLLARLLSRKAAAYQPRSSLTSRASGPAPGHRIKDRDYLGWMDFGRRSAEEYEYTS